MSDTIIEQLRALRLTQFANVLENQRQQPNLYAELDFEERLGLLLDQELVNRDQNRIKRLRKQAKLRLRALPEELQYSAARGLIQSQCTGLMNGNYLRSHQNLLITGATGCGKTFLACAFGEQACRQYKQVRYYRVGRLLDAIAAARVDGSYHKLLLQLAKYELLILDDWGLEKLSARQSSELLEVIEDRHQISSTLVTSQVPASEWHSLLPNPTVADAILDRLLHNSHSIALKGESMRKQLLTQSDQMD